MSVRDFGHFDAPLVLFGGVYSNVRALEALVALAGESPAISTGDLVGFGAEPAETVARVRGLGWHTIAGHSDQQIARDADDSGDAIELGGARDLLSSGWCNHARAAIGPEDRAWMANLPEIGTFVQRSRRYAVIHGGATDIGRFIWPTTAEGDLQAEIAAIEARVGSVDGIVAGHSGIAFHRMIGGHQWINAGAIGLPPHDGRPETRYAVLDDGDVVIHRLSYDHDAAAATMQAAEISPGYGKALLTGIWPSEDILPIELRR